MITFNALATHSLIIEDNEFFSQHFNPDALFRYDSNFFQLKYSPTREEFELIEAMHWTFSEDNDLNHVKFYWPENQGVRPDTLDYLNQESYGLEKLELYTIDPLNFPETTVNSEIALKVVTEEQLLVFKSLNYIEDKRISEAFASAKQPFYDMLFQDTSVSFLLAYFKGQPVGSCILIESNLGIEIDDVFTLKAFRLKGIATALQSFIMKEAASKEKMVFLVADAEDSVKEMYIKNGFTYEGFRIGAQKVINGDD